MILTFFCNSVQIGPDLTNLLLFCVGVLSKPNSLKVPVVEVYITTFPLVPDNCVCNGILPVPVIISELIVLNVGVFTKSP